MDGEAREARDRILLRFDDGLRIRRRVSCLAGVDEVGRGPLAGPVVAAAVVLPRGVMIPGADDSKVLSRPERERLFVEIKKVALAWAWGTVHSPTIDRINILRASRLAMRRALGKLLPSPDLVVVDGWTIPRLEFDQVALPKADGLSLSVACASILAKVRRDRIMIRWGKRYPEYHFAGNKGYATLRHLEALDRFGPCPLHRRSFAPVAQLRLPLVMT